MKYTPKFAVITTALAASLAFTACTSQAATKDAPKEAPKVLTSIAERLVEEGYPGAIITRTSPDGTAETATAGTADLATDAPIPADGEVRIGSASKTFTAVVALQLVEEGLLELDRSVDTYLPGIIKGEGIDPKAITVRQLLQHTSGLPEFTDLVAKDTFGQRDAYRSTRDVLDLALERPADFPAGERHQYTNTNYIALGLIIERITQRPLAEQIHDRIVTPLDLKHTYLPDPGETGLRGEHPRGYHIDTDGELRDLTEYDTSWAAGAGAMVSTPAELNTFMKAVLDGELLEPAELDQMLTGIPTGDEENFPGATYGLGIESSELSAGTAWGHNGDIPGYQTRNAVAEDGTAVTITVTALPYAIYDGPQEEIFEGPQEELIALYSLTTDALEEALSTP
ncbi:serine hydrolase domain-containing protein [Arthrobacter zhaoguopingii]|uniref:serine hydrolase domain-containing protein n=1 Tax=Arthrobacter zhaoguopingii TaxID=2681491 RepID=UPI00135B068F|nr:serine hydrolase domain-containing protein [Arthrobacter zhaoguopingii]